MCYQLLYAIRHAIRGIQRRKLKNLISTLGILIGVSLLAGVQIATDSLVNGMQETVNLRYGNGDIIISKGFYQPEFFNKPGYFTLQGTQIARLLISRRPLGIRIIVHTITPDGF